MGNKPSASIKVFGTTATISDRKWTCDKPNMADVLNGEIRLLFPYGLGPEYPVPDNAIAIETAKRFGGKVLSLLPAPKGEPGAIY